MWENLLCSLLGQRLFRGKVWVSQDLLCRRSLDRIVHKHGLHELIGCRRQLVAEHFRKHALALGRRPQQLKPRHVDEAGPLVPVRRAQHVVNLVQLTELCAVARKDGLLGENLHHDAGGAPNIYRSSVLGLTEKQFGRSVPDCDDAVRVVELVPFGVETSKTKVGNLENTVAADQNVGCLDVSVQHTTHVEVLETFEHLLGQMFLLRWLQLEIGVVE